MIFLRIAAVGGVVALLLWAMEDRRWISAIDFLFPFFSIGAAGAIASFEAQDGLRRPAILLLLATLTVFSSGVALWILSFFREVSPWPPAGLFFGGLLYSLTLMAMLGWLFVPAVYVGASLCRDWLYNRPWSDMALWSLMAVLFASVWFTDVYGPLPVLERLGWLTLTLLFSFSALFGAGIGWLFYRLTGYPLSR
jgi:hypothetical protein